MANLLNQLRDFLEKEAYSSILIPASQKLALDSLLVVLSLDAQKREQNLEIIEYSSLSTDQKFSTDTPHVSRLQFKVLLPFKVDDLCSNEVSAFIHFINLSIDLPGYEFNELEGQVLYRYMWIISGENLDETLVKSILAVIKLNLSLFSDVIETLAKGKMSFNDLLSNIVKEFKKSSE